MVMVLFQSFISSILLTACYCFDGIKAIRQTLGPKLAYILLFKFQLMSTIFC